MKKALGLLIIILPLISLNQSLWLDEAVTAVAVRDSSWLQLVTKFASHDFHPPFFYLFTKLWTTIFGLSEISLRLPSVFFTWATGILLYSLVGFWPSLLFLLNPLSVYYSQEARMYSMVTFFLFLSYYGLSKNKIGLFLLGISLAINTFYGSLFLIVAMIIYLFCQKKSNWAFLAMIVTVFSIFILSPLIYTQWQHSLLMRQTVVNWSQVLGPASLKNLALIPLKFSLGRISFEPKWWYYLLGGSWTIFVWLGVRWQDRRLILLVLPIVLGLVFSIFTPLLSYFRFLYLLPFLALLLDRGEKLRGQKVIILFGFSFLSLIYLFNSNWHREDWRLLAYSLPNKARLYGISSSLPAISYYRQDVKIFDLRTAKLVSPTIFVAPYTMAIYGFNYNDYLRSRGYRLETQQSFRQLVLETWTR